MPQTTDELIASCAAAKALGYLDEAAFLIGQADTRRKTLTESRLTHATPLITRGASADARCRISKYAYATTQVAARVEYNAAKACRKAATPVAKRKAMVANKAAVSAARFALEVADRARITCIEAIEDAEKAEQWYIEHCDD